MKLAITDACIFIDLIDLQLTSKFFGLPIEIHTSLDVFNELYENQKEILIAYQSVGKLIIHNIQHEERLRIRKENFPKALSEIDKTVAFLAEKLDAAILSSDKAVRKCAKSKTIEYHGMLWIFDKLIEENLLSSSDAIVKIDQLVTCNYMFQNNTELVSEIVKRKKKWVKKGGK